MNRFKNNNLIFIIGFIFIFFLCVGIGYATLNKTLIINGTSNIEKPNWDIQFENIQVTDGSIESIVAPAISNKTTINFEVTLSAPGEYYEFTVDVKNNGSMDAMVDELVKLTELSATQQKYLDYTIKYENDEQVTSNQLLKQGEFVRLKVKIEFKKDITESDLPQSTETLNLGFKVIYIQNDDTAVEVKDNGIITINFTVDGIAYTASKGMTWEQWINSKFNTSKEIMTLDEYISKNGRIPSQQYSETELRARNAEIITMNEIFVSTNNHLDKTHYPLIYDKDDNFISGYGTKPGINDTNYEMFNQLNEIQYANTILEENSAYKYIFYD